MAQTNASKGNPVSDSSHRVAQDARQLGDDIKQAASDAQRVVMDKANEAGQRIKDLGAQAASVAQDEYASLRNTAGDFLRQGSEQAMQVEKQLQQRIVEKPMQSIMIAAGVGFLLGVIMCRR